MIRSSVRMLVASLLLAGVSIGCSNNSAEAEIEKAREEFTKAVETAVSEETLESTRQAMKSVLRNLVTSQEMFYIDSTYYATNTTILQSAYSASTIPNVEIAILSASRDGFAATARHKTMAIRCRITVGNVADDGVPLCD